MSHYETELWPFVQAKHFGAKRTVNPRLIVIHTTQNKETAGGAENIARYFARMEDGRVASAHIAVDTDSIIQCVKDSFVAFAAPGANHDGVQVELVSYAEQTKAQWRDKESILTLALAADAVAQYCLKYEIPAIRLTDEQVRQGMRGICGHDQISRVYKKSTHLDPGPAFPWTRFIWYVKGSLEDRR